MPTEISEGMVVVQCDHCPNLMAKEERHLALFCLHGPPRCDDCKRLLHGFGYDRKGNVVFTQDHLLALEKAKERHDPWTKWPRVMQVTLGNETPEAAADDPYGWLAEDLLGPDLKAAAEDQASRPAARGNAQGVAGRHNDTDDERANTTGPRLANTTRKTLDDK